jgi:hypothetical protein
MAAVGGRCYTAATRSIAAMVVKLWTTRWSRLAARRRRGPGAGPGFAIKDPVRSGGTLTSE